MLQNEWLHQNTIVEQFKIQDGRYFKTWNNTHIFNP